MKVVTVLGTRPEIIRLARVIPLLDKHCQHVLVHTGQNFDPALSQLFFDELGLRAPDHHLGIRADSFGSQIGQIMARTEEIFAQEKPDRLLLLGDTNSSLCALIAKRMGIRVYHMEAGNRCYDDRVPEEVNRRAIDHSSDVLMPYTERSRQNLLAEGIPGRRIVVTGNPILEVMDAFAAKDPDAVFTQAGVERKRYFLVTLHRAENVDDPERLKSFVAGLQAVHKKYGLPVLISTHPRTAQRIEKAKIDRQGGNGLIFSPPFGFPSFIALQRNAAGVLTDSGTVQEESCILGVPNVTLRDTTERPETLECGSNILSGCEPDDILRTLDIAMSRVGQWTPPVEYRATNVSATVVNVLLQAPSNW